ILRPPLRSTLFPYTTLFRSDARGARTGWFASRRQDGGLLRRPDPARAAGSPTSRADLPNNLEPRSSACPNRARDRGPHLEGALRSEEHTSELQSQSNLVCRL